MPPTDAMRIADGQQSQATRTPDALLREVMGLSGTTDPQAAQRMAETVIIVTAVLAAMRNNGMLGVNGYNSGYPGDGGCSSINQARRPCGQAYSPSYYNSNPFGFNNTPLSMMQRLGGGYGRSGYGGNIGYGGNFGYGGNIGQSIAYMALNRLMWGLFNRR